jgi:hypothetical protein
MKFCSCLHWILFHINYLKSTGFLYRQIQQWKYYIWLNEIISVLYVFLGKTKIISLYEMCLLRGTN